MIGTTAAKLKVTGAMPTLAWACCHVFGTSHAHASVGMAPKPVIIALADHYGRRGQNHRARNHVKIAVNAGAANKIHPRRVHTVPSGGSTSTTRRLS